MEVAFQDIKDEFIVVYLEDLIVSSKQRQDHVYHLCRVLDKCCQQEISLNPNKLIFGVIEGKLLGHIVLKEGIKIHRKRVKSIPSHSLLTSKSVVHSFFKKVNFL